MKIISLDNSKSSKTLSQVAQSIQDGGIVLFPFDTVYGLVCDPENQKAVDRIFDIKGRDLRKVLGLAADGTKMTKCIANLNQNQIDYIAAKTPGPYTFLVKFNAGSNIDTRCQKEGVVGIRIPGSQNVLDLITAFGRPIAQTSANKSGQPNCYSVEDFFEQFGDNATVDIVVDGGKLERKAPSQLIDLTGPTPKIIERSS